MTFFPFVDPNRRPQAKIRKMTEELTQKFQAIDPDLTLIHNDNFIDYGPEVFPQLSSIYWDPRVANHSMEHFVYSEYQLKYRNYPFYWFTPYGERIYKSYKKPAGESDPWREALDVIDSNVLKVIHDYQVHNILYWKDFFTEKQLEQERLKPHKRVSEFVGLGKIISSPFSFIDPKHRPLAAVEKNTEFLETQLDHLDSRLTVIHDDSYIDFGPDIGHFLAECPYDPEEDEPDDPIRYLSHYDYHIYFNETPIYGLSPYSIGTSFHGDFFNGGIANVTYLGLSKELDDAIEVIMRKYMLYNKYYWRNNYSYEDFQEIVRNYKKSWKLN